MTRKEAEMSPPNPVAVGNVRIGKNCPLALIAGPCVMEPGEMTLRIARRLVEICAALGVPLIFKASFDKANRTSGSSFRGPGLVEGMKIFARVKSETGLPVTTDIHETIQAKPLAETVDLLQVPAFLARQTDLLEAAAGTGRPVNVKKGQFMAPWDMSNVVAKLTRVRRFGSPLDRAWDDVWLWAAGQRFPGDPSDAGDRRSGRLRRHAFGAASKRGGGRNGVVGSREMIPTLAQAAVAAGCDALFLEVHPDPDRALSDGPNSLRLDELQGLLSTCLRIRAGDHRPNRDGDSSVRRKIRDRTRDGLAARIDVSQFNDVDWFCRRRFGRCSRYHQGVFRLELSHCSLEWTGPPSAWG